MGIEDKEKNETQKENVTNTKLKNCIFMVHEMRWATFSNLQHSKAIKIQEI